MKGSRALLLACVPALAMAASNTPGTALPTYANLAGESALDNDTVHLQRYVLAPGQATGRFTSQGDALMVFVRGGVLTAHDTGRSTVWRDGRVAWHAAHEPGNGGFFNSGRDTVEFIWLSLKHPPRRAGLPGREPSENYHLNYPNIPGEDAFENDRVVVQRFVVAPGQWEGPHAHRPGMVYIHVKGGQWAARSKSEAEHLYPEASPDGEVGWMQPIDASVGHESGNVGKEPIDLIWVTLKD
jgi:hypothetical protein